jgi:hypothetical protein
VPGENGATRELSSVLAGGGARVRALVTNRDDLRTATVALRFTYHVPPDTIALDEIVDRIVVEFRTPAGERFSRATIDPNEVNLNPERLEPGLQAHALPTRGCVPRSHPRVRQLRIGRHAVCSLAAADLRAHLRVARGHAGALGRRVRDESCDRPEAALSPQRPARAVVVVAGWALLCWTGHLAWDAFYLERWPMLAGAFVVGVLFTLAIVLPAPGSERAALFGATSTSGGSRTRNGATGSWTRRCTSISRARSCSSSTCCRSRRITG